MSNSSLICSTALSPNYTRGRTFDDGIARPIRGIMVHCVSGQANLNSCNTMFMDTKRQASSNYVISCNGEIVLKVDEANRAWTSGGAGKKGTYYPVLGTKLNMTGREMDYNCVTIEVASDNIPPYKVTDKALNALIKLVADIAKRNNIGKLLFSNDPKLIGVWDKQNMGLHKWFDVNEKGYLRACPGGYLESKMSYIADEANKINGYTKADEKKEDKTEDNTVTYVVQKGDTLSKIARQFNTTVENIAKLNNLGNPNVINVGQKLVIKGTSVTPSKPQQEPISSIPKLASSKPNLSLGSVGQEVANLQADLNYVLKDRKISVDGDFGRNTDASLRLFQLRYKLKVDGVYGAESQAKMFSLLK